MDNIEPESWRDSLPNQGHWIPPAERPPIVDPPDLDFSILNPKVSPRIEEEVAASVTQTVGGTARDAAILGISAIKLGKDKATEYAQSGEIQSTLLKGAGKVVDWGKAHPKKAGLIGLGTAALVVGHHRKKSNSNIGSTINMRPPSRAMGSAAGMNNARGAVIQPTGVGYDNRRNQQARYGFNNAAYTTPPPPSFNNNISVPSLSNVADYRTSEDDDMQNDQQFSRMI